MAERADDLTPYKLNPLLVFFICSSILRHFQRHNRNEKLKTRNDEILADSRSKNDLPMYQTVVRKRKTHFESVSKWFKAQVM